MTESMPLPGPPARRRVVVGVDGSTGSLAALDTALAEARRRGAVLRIVTAWHVPPFVGAVPAPVTAAVGELFVDLEAVAHQQLLAALDHLPPVPGVIVESAVVEGRASAVLLEAARHAELLVVGRRGHNRLSELLLGSTSRACAEHAACPVLVVPRPPRAGDRREPAGAAVRRRRSGSGTPQSEVTR